MFLFLIEDWVKFVDSWPEVGWVSSESDFKHAQKLVHTVHKTLWWTCDAFYTGFSFINDHLISQISWHNEIMFDNECAFLVVNDESLNDLCSHDSLLTVQISWWLINQISISTLGQSQNNGNSLKLSSWKFLDFIVNDGIQLHWLGDFWCKSCCHPWLTAFLIK